jgi:hypothetical protein
MRKIILTVSLIVALLMPAAVSAVSSTTVYASAFNSTNASDQACSGISGKVDSGDCTAPGRSLTALVKVLLNLLSAIIGVVAVVMIIVSGFKFVTAAGDAGKVAAARSTMVYAIVGLLIVAFAQFITQFLLKKLT